MKTPVAFTLNGQERAAFADPGQNLLEFLRRGCGDLTPKYGCGQGACGACTVMIGGRLARSCITFALQVQGEDLRTIEGFSTGEELSPIQESFRRCHGLQCGFCTPGFVLATEALLAENAAPTESEVREFLSGNICRCTGYVGIVDAVMDAANRSLDTRGEER